MWTGTIGFGLVSIPVKLYTASQSETLDLDMLDRRDHARIRYIKVNEDTGKQVDMDDIVKGYKYEDDYVILSDADFKAASKTRSETLEIEQFMYENEIDSLYFESPYYLEPDKGGKKVYQLLLEAMKKSRKVGLVRITLRNKEHLAIIKPLGKVLALIQIRYEQDIKDPGELDLPSAEKLKQSEVEMAIELIDQYTDRFDPSQYHDTYRDELLKVIEAKAKGKKLPAAKKSDRKPTKAADIMAQLKASLHPQRKAS